MPPDHHEWMQRAIDLAAQGRGTVSPNPPVGCVLVKNGVVVGEGWHQRCGDAHAEVNALQMAGEAARGATAYVTLMPCAHTGRTPPCTDALIRAGVAEVFVAVDDPNPTSCDGATQLREAGIPVTVGIGQDEAAWVMRGFLKQIHHQLPAVTYKYAMTLDGRIATATGDSRWISNEESRGYVQQIRATHDAIMVGIGTALADDPRLNLRASDKPQPKRVIVDAKLSLAPDARLFHEPGGEVIVLTTEDASCEQAARLEEAGATILRTAATTVGRVNLHAGLQALTTLGIRDILCEGGATLAGGLLDAGLIDEVIAFIAPKMLGSGLPAICGKGVASMDSVLQLYHISTSQFADDICITARMRP